MHTTTTHQSFLLPPPLPPLPLRKTRVERSPYPVASKPVAPVTPGRKAYSQLKSMLSSFKLTNARKRTTQGKTMGTMARGDEMHAPSGQLALGHEDATQVQLYEMQAPTHVLGGQLAPGHPNTTQVEPRRATICIDGYYGWAQVKQVLDPSLRCLITQRSSPQPTLPKSILILPISSLSLSIGPSCRCVHQYALHIIWRVKCLNPDFNPKHAHGTYLTALMLAAKQSHDVDYSINARVSAGQHIFEPSQLRENEWRMCERLEWKFLVRPMDLVKLAWTIEVGYGELDEGVPPPGSIHAGSEGLGGMFAASVASCSPHSPHRRAAA
ncbi:hypothetical protein FRC11_008985 [Ceratobasidium sp. 423]|nr:hypothetical protein FRC11_008985 [Ceratobasidium sp. 423]